MSNTTINGIVLDNGSNAVIIERSVQKTSSLTPMPIYSRDSDETDVFDFGGVIKTLSLTGSYVADSTANLKVWVESVEALQQGHQDTGAGAPWPLVDDLLGSLNVKIMDFSSVQTEAEPTRVSWTIKLVQSSGNA